MKLRIVPVFHLNVQPLMKQKGSTDIEKSLEENEISLGEHEW